jgi:catechol 2,3-dioxygenase-like lactoylglutathione lyase family enzyme
MPAEPSTPERFPYGSPARYHLQHAHLFASDLELTLAFYRRWFDARVVWDGDVGGARNVFVQIGKGALHFYGQPPRDAHRSGGIHHIGIQVAGLRDLYERMKAGGVRLPNPIRAMGGGGYFMIEAPDHVLIELFEPGPEVDRNPALRDYFGFGQTGA